MRFAEKTILALTLVSLIDSANVVLIMKDGKIYKKAP